eukprot:765576-Hanusia_phi.AAC.7
MKALFDFSCPARSQSPGPGPRVYHSSTSYQSDVNSDRYQIFFFGGIDESSVLQNDLWTLQVNPDSVFWISWDPSTTRPSGRAAHTSIFYNFQVKSGVGREGVKQKQGMRIRKTIIVIGGQGDGGAGSEKVVSSMWYYDTEQFKWKRTELLGSGQAVPRVAFHTMEYAAVSHQTAQQGPGLLLVLFGSTNRVKFSNKVYYAGINDMVWKRARPSGTQPAGRSGHAAEAFGSSLVVFGGVSPVVGMYGDTWKFDVSDGIWSMLSYGSDAQPPARAYSCSFKIWNYMVDEPLRR